jgi:hypothetical protein
MTYAPVQYDPADIEMRFEPLEVTPDLLLSGFTLWNTPVKANIASKLDDVIGGLFELSWEVWPATVAVSRISVFTEPRITATFAEPPEITWARVSIFGFGFVPGIPVTTKWNNAFGFPDNGEGANSIKLQSPVPDAGGRFAFQTIHRGVLRPAAEWRWEPNLQLVLVAYQGETIGTPNERAASQRYIPPHVLWQWIPHWPVVSASP